MKTVRTNYSKIVLSLLTFTLAICLHPIGSSAQLSYSKGFIIKNNQDTIKGYICDRGDIGNATVCKFKPTPMGKVQKYYPGDIVSYRFDEGNYYASLEIIKDGVTKPAFAEVLLDGEIDLFYYPKNNELSYYIRNKKGSVIGLPNELFILRRRTAANVTASLNSSSANFLIASYKDSLDAVFSDCSALKPKVEDLFYDSKSLIDISKEYINCVCNKDKCITYEKNLKKASPTFGIYSGLNLTQVNLLKSDIQSNIEMIVPVGIFYNIPITMLNERISVQPEIQFRKLNFKEFYNIPLEYADITMNSSQISIPLSIRYSFYPKKLRPSVGIGKEFAYSFNTNVKTTPSEDTPDGYVKDMRNKGFFTHYYSRGGWFVDLGIDYRLSSKLSIYSNLRVSTCENLIIEELNYANFSFDAASKKNNLNKPHSNIYRTNTASLYLGIRFL